MGKRAFDITASLLLLIVLGPAMLVTALIVACAIGRPVFFRQLRPGMNSRLFTLYKFVTMTSARDAHGNLLPDAERLTSVGRLLRATSLDELPELLNVLKGDMSLVGPRPLLAEYLGRYSATQARRHEVRPGITGWAQVNGRNSLSWSEKFDRDVWYVDHRTFWLDIRILFMTVEKVIRRDGISHDGQATMTPFLGNESESIEPQEALA